MVRQKTVPWPPYGRRITLKSEPSRFYGHSSIALRPDRQGQCPAPGTLCRRTLACELHLAIPFGSHDFGGGTFSPECLRGFLCMCGEPALLECSAELVEVGQNDLLRPAGEEEANERIHEGRRGIQCRSASEKDVGEHCRDTSAGGVSWAGCPEKPPYGPY